MYFYVFLQDSYERLHYCLCSATLLYLGRVTNISKLPATMAAPHLVVFNLVIRKISTDDNQPSDGFQDVGYS